MTIPILLILICSCKCFMEVFEIDLGNTRRGGPIQVIDLDDIMNNLNKRRGVMREITIEVSPEGITETTKTIDNEGNETIEITQKGNLNKGGKRTNAGEIIFGLDNSIENLIFGLLNGQGIEIGFGSGNPMIRDQEKENDHEEEAKEHDNERHRFDNITEAELEFDEEKKASPIVIEKIEEEVIKEKNKSPNKRKNKNKEKKIKDTSSHKTLGEDLITQINHAHVKVEELKKEKPKINILAKVIKFVFYFMALIIMIFILRITMKHFSLTKGSSTNIETSSDTINKVENIITDNTNENKEKLDKAD